MNPLPLKKGDRIWVTCDGQTEEALVVLASGNYRSLMVTFEAILGGFVGMAPLFWADAGRYEDLMGGVWEVAYLN